MNAIIEGEIIRCKQLLVMKRYSTSTIRCYLHFLKDFFYRHERVNPWELTDHEARAYILEAVDSGKSRSLQNQSINAIKFYFEKVLERDRKVYRLDRPKRELHIPVVLSEDEVRCLLGATANLKHRALLSLIYACGLRIGEALQLRMTDINSKDSMIHIKQAKGRKDRIVPLSQKLLLLLRYYYREYRPKVYLFEGQRGGGTQYSQRSAQQVFRRSLARAGIDRRVTLHTLRHSYATHLLRSGTNLRVIQKLLGHNSSKTTEIYTHITDIQLAQVASPFDNIA